MALLEEVRGWGWALRFQKPTPFPLCSLPPPAGGSSCVLPQLCLPSCLCSGITDSNPVGLEAQLDTFFDELPWSRCFVTATEKLNTPDASLLRNLYKRHLGPGSSASCPCGTQERTAMGTRGFNSFPFYNLGQSDSCGP